MTVDLEHIPGPNNNQVDSSRTLLNWQKIYYEKGLRQNYWCDIAIEAEAANEKDSFKEDDQLKITRRDTGEVITFYIDRRENVKGLVRLMGRGTVDKDLIRPDSPNNKSSDWSSLDTSGITGDLSSLQPAVSINVQDNRSVSSFKSHGNENLKATIERLIDRTDQIFRRDHETDTLEILNPPTTSTGSWDEDIQIEAVKEETDDSDTPAKVKVIGKSEGEAQVTGSYGPNYTQGDNVETIVDKTVETDAEAADLAENVYNRLQESDSYSFDLIDNGVSFELGDIKTINAGSVNVTNQDLRIVKEKRTLQPQQNETVELVVRNTARRKGLPGQDEELAETNKGQRDANSFEQGDTFSITYTDKDIADSSDHSEGTFTLPAWVESSDQIISAELQTRRVTKKFTAPNSTENSVTNAGMTNDDAFTNAGVTNRNAGGGTVIEEGFFSSTFSNGVDNSFSSVATQTPTSDGAGCIVYITFNKTGSITGRNYYTIDISVGHDYDDDGTVEEIVSAGTAYPEPTLLDDTDAGMIFNGFVYCPYPIQSGNDIDVYLRTASGTTGPCEIETRVKILGKHVHPNDFDDNTHINSNTFDDANHSNDINPGLNTETESALDFSYEVNNNGANTLANSVNVGDSPTTVDIKPDLNDPSSDRTNNVEVWPNSSEATVYNVITIKAYRPK